jgi:hypothetical protein
VRRNDAWHHGHTQALATVPLSSRRADARFADKNPRKAFKPDFKIEERQVPP